MDGMGYWALVWMQVATAATNAVGVWIANDWRPSRPLRGTGVRAMLVFGGFQTLANIVSYFTRNIDKALLGFVYGSHLTGVYSKAFSLLLLPALQIAAPMMSVATPALSRLQDDPEHYRDYYLKAVKALPTPRCRSPRPWVHYPLK